MSQISKKRRLKDLPGSSGGNPSADEPAAVQGVSKGEGFSPLFATGFFQEMPRWPRWKVAGVCASLAILVFIVFGQTVGHGFLNYDDHDYVYQNPVILRGLSFENIGWAFTHVHSANWHPLTTILHMLDCQMYGLWAGGHHLTNVLLHAACAVCLFLLLLQMTGAIWRSAFVAALFAIHPLRVESVAWVSELKDVLSGLFFMLTLAAYTRYARRPRSVGRYAAVALCLALGLMSKPMLVTIPFVLLLIDYWPLARFQKASQLPALLREKAPLFALSVLSCVATVFAQQGAIRPVAEVPFSVRVGNALVAYVIYIGKLIYPVHLAVLYPLLRNGWPAWRAMLAFLLLAGLTAGACSLRRRRPFLLVGWLWYVGMLVPVIGFLQVGDQAYADRYTYLPQIGLCLAGTWVAADWAGDRRSRRITLGCAGFFILCALLAAAYRQTTLWRDPETLWTHTIACTQDNFTAHGDLGDALLQQGKTAEAIAEFRAAIHINPSYSAAHYNLGVALLGLGRTEEAIAEFRTAIQINPAYAKAHNNLGIALLRQGKSAEAMDEYAAALKADPAEADAHYNLANAFLDQGRTQEAVAEYGESLRLNPAYPDAQNNLGTALVQQGRTEEGIARYRESLRLNPAYVNAHINLGNVLLHSGRTSEAVAEFRAVLKLDPANADAHNDLGVIWLNAGRFEDAIAEFREAVQINPGDADAHDNLGGALLQRGHPADAIEELQKALDLKPADLSTRNNLAWLLATVSQASLRDGARAVQLASQASQSTTNDNPVILRTLAAAYAQDGQFPNAVQIAQKALQLAQARGNTALASSLPREIQLYKAGHPFEDAP
jgi:tetratricopeptide (TPR) repeat protein